MLTLWLWQHVAILRLCYKKMISVREIITVFREIHAKHINTLCGQNVEFLNVKPIGFRDFNYRIRNYDSETRNV